MAFNRTKAPTEGAMLHLEFLKFVSGIGYRTFQQQDRYILNIIVVCIAISVIFIIFLNSFVVHYYWDRLSSRIPFLFTLVAFGDLGMGISGVLNIFSLLTYQQVELPEDKPSYVDPHFERVLMINYAWSNVAVKVSVFVNVILAVTRAMAIVNPFRRFNRSVITQLLVSYLLLWVLIVGGEIYFTRLSIDKSWQKFLRESNSPLQTFNSKMFMHAWYFLFTTVPGYMLSLDGIGQIEQKMYCENPYNCSFHFCYDPPAGAGFDNEGCEQFFGFFWLLAPNVLPALVVLVCLVLIIATFWKRVERLSSKDRSVNNRSTVSVILVSIVYIISNTISFIFVVVMIYSPLLKRGEGVERSGSHITVSDPGHVRAFYWLMFVFQNGVPLLNSLLNPAIIIFRGTTLRQNFMKQFLGVAVDRTLEDSVRT
ncbi:hypothetical protein ACHWQZ_G007869 [Mnemiopsis leidyi]